jgi:hypothetical protein
MLSVQELERIKIRCMPIFFKLFLFVIQYGLPVPVFWPAEKITMEKFTSILITDATLNVIWQVF